MLQLLLSVFTDTSVIYQHIYKLCSILSHIESATDTCVTDEHICHEQALVLYSSMCLWFHSLTVIHYDKPPTWVSHYYFATHFQDVQFSKSKRRHNATLLNLHHKKSPLEVSGVSSGAQKPTILESRTCKKLMNEKFQRVRRSYFVCLRSIKSKHVNVWMHNISVVEWSTGVCVVAWKICKLDKHSFCRW